MGAHRVAAEACARLAEIVPAASSICVGFSGGLDSSVLLDVLADGGRTHGYAVTALHVSHGLSPNAGAWERACERFCEARGVELAVVRVAVDRDAPEGLEAAARAARHAAFAARPEPFIALAHHLDDQAETVLLQLLRGTGLKGVAAMPASRALAGSQARIVRPLLDIARARLLDYAASRGLAWIEDESNDSLRFDRNYLRHEVGPRLDARYPGWRVSLARFARHAGAAGELLEQLATLDGVPAGPGAPMPLDARLDDERRANALRAFLARNDVPMPPEARLAEMARQLHAAKPDARVRIDHAGVAIVRHKDHVRIERGLASAAPAGERWRVAWHHERDLDLGAGRGSVHFEAGVGAGIGARDPAGWYFAARTGGEKLRLATGRPTRTLKNLLQEAAVPAWQRENLPLLFHGERLVWVPGVGIAAEYACEAGKEGLAPCWRVAGKPPLC